MWTEKFFFPLGGGDFNFQNLNACHLVSLKNEKGRHDGRVRRFLKMREALCYVNNKRCWPE